MNSTRSKFRSMKVLDFLNTIELPMKIGLVYNLIEEKDIFPNSYKTFKRDIDELREREFLEVKKIIGGNEGSTTIIKRVINFY